MNQNQVRQGDVFLEASRLKKIPAEAVKVEPQNGRVVLRYGEATGHHHSVDSRTAELWQLPDGWMLLKVSEPTTLDHQEHAAAPFAPGLWVVPQEQVEYTPAEIRRVAD